MCSSVTRADDLDDGYASYNEGNYTQAMELLLPSAIQGHAVAQTILGLMYYKGEGVIQDDKEAARWFQKAAKQGHVNAQYNLGMMYDDGKGVLRNYLRAHMWFNLAASNGHKKGSRYRERVAKKMTPSKISQAQNMAKKCEKNNYKNCK